MEFETEMKRLTAELMGAFENRVATVREAQTNTHNQVRANQSTRGAMATQQQGHLHQQMDSLRAQVTELRNTAQQRMRDTYAAHCDMAAAQRQRHTQQMNDLRRSTADYMNHTATARMDMGRAQRNMLGDFINQLRAINAAFVAETNTARKQASDDKQHELDDFMKALQGDINQMRADTMAFMQTVGAMRAEMSATQHENLSSAKAQLTADITAMRQGMQDVQAALRADHDAAHVEWLRFRQAKGGQQTAEAQPDPMPEPVMTAEMPVVEMPVAEAPVVEAPVAEAPVVEAPVVESPVVEAPVVEAPVVEALISETPTSEVAGITKKDDLTVIRGIGQAMQHRLNNINIFTFQQLAVVEPEALREALGEIGRRVKIEEWITQAIELNR